VNKNLWGTVTACLLGLVLILTGIVGINGIAIASETGTWHKITLPTKATLLDIAFTADPNHGWLVGTEGILLETLDGGKTWQPHNLTLGGGIYRFVSISFAGDEGWIAGKPGLLLHTEDGGRSWTRIGLSAKLPGDPTLIKALGLNSAEMATDIGAIYQTTDKGQNWKAMVTQAVGNVRNLSRSEDGRYIAVSAKGNFYSTWEPGQVAWKQHNRNSSRRVQKMGYAPDGRTWMLNRGGQLQFSEPYTLDKWEKPQFPKAAEGIGLLDLTYQSDLDVWVTGGSSSLLHSTDGGKTWIKDESLTGVGSNFYGITFVGENRGFILGQDGTLLSYSP